MLGKADSDPSGDVPPKDSKMPIDSAKCMKTIENNSKNENGIQRYLI